MSRPHDPFRDAHPPADACSVAVTRTHRRIDDARQVSNIIKIYGRHNYVGSQKIQTEWLNIGSGHTNTTHTHLVFRSISIEQQNGMGKTQ